ncbi:hypothetical protein HBH92_152770 [Parastagonospora nodorum]|nr:hypothetical protein HBH52_052560 [Parastagonospora nodorum]KAH4408111.1 hypothetical protein HBH92_152770 [Parastagonospora nodorum]KAH4442075.1 hypothetical protein HBH93_076780 [Parastagonospora nodorum]KAH4453930.1 hypothetical protein HBH91_105010 [Parastagonospora nodorum]KAH4510497.1 hypothetical protein HBH89_055320 [Parastagonospora nodorum]
MDAPPASTYGRIMKTLADENAVASARATLQEQLIQVQAQCQQEKARANKAEEKITILEQKHIKAIARECMQADAIKTRHELEYQEQERGMERIAEQKDVLQERIFKMEAILKEVEKLKNTRGEKRKANDDARGERRIKADPAMLIYD